MTRAEFDANVTDYGDLYDLIVQYEMYDTYELIDEDEMNRRLNEAVAEYEGDWYRLYNYLYDINAGYDWYVQRGEFEYVACSGDEFEDMKDAIRREMEECGYFDEEEEEESDDGSLTFGYPEMQKFEAEKLAEVQSDISVEELIFASVDSVAKLA